MSSSVRCRALCYVARYVAFAVSIPGEAARRRAYDQIVLAIAIDRATGMAVPIPVSSNYPHHCRVRPPQRRSPSRRSVGLRARTDGPPTGPSFVSSLPSLLAAPPPPPPPQIQMKCLGMRQSITQSTPSPHEVLRRASEEREGGRGHSRIRSCTSSRRAETATGEPRRVRTATTDSLTPEAPHRCTATATECKFRLVR